MKRLLATAAVIALGTTAQALVLSEEATPLDAGETFVEENQEFVGDPVYDSNGVSIGTVAKVTTTDTGDRKIFVEFHDGMMDGIAGWAFTLDDAWESGGSIDLTWSAEAIHDYLMTQKSVTGRVYSENVLD